MLDVSEAVKQAYINGNAQTEIFLTVTKTDGTVSVYDPTNILSGSVSIVESLCSSEAFDISRVEKNQLTFTLFNITEGLKGLQGASVVAKQRVTLPDSNETVDIPLGTYTIAEAMNDGDYLYKCTCYDTTMYKLDGLIDDWWKAVRFPITLRNLAISMFEYLGCLYDIPAEFNNYDYVVPQMNAVFEGVTGSEILGYIQEIVGGFFKANRLGVITLRVPVPTASGLYPHIGLYPHTGLYPRRSSSGFGVDGEVGIGDWNYPQIVGDLQLGDYDVKRVTKVQIRGTEDDIGIIAGGGTNTYVIQGNPLLFNLTDETGRQIAENILSAVGQIAYKPFSGKFMAQPYVEVGDMAMIMTLEQKEGVSPIFQRTLSGARLAFDTFQCLGLEEREQVSSVNRKLTTVNQRTHEVINTVDELVSTVTQVEQTVETHTTQISQNSNEINLIAERTGYQNYVVNGDFSDFFDPFKGWTKFQQSGDTLEIVDDSRFASGKACHFIQGTTGNTFLRYDIDFGEGVELQGKRFVIYVRGEFISSFSSDGYLHARLRGKSASGTWSNLATWSIAPAIGTKNMRLYVTFTSSTVITALQLLPCFSFSGSAGEAIIGEICMIMIDPDDDMPSAGFYTDLPKNNLVSQINLSPSGVQIRGEKVDIYGLTTFHDPDGTGGTTIDGATITAGNIIGGTVTTPTLVFNVDTAPSELSSGYYTMYDYVDSQTKQVYGAELKTDNGDYATGFIVNGGFALESKIYPAFIETENNHRLLINFGSTNRSIDNRGTAQSASPGLYIANSTNGTNYVSLLDANGIRINSDGNINITSRGNTAVYSIENSALLETISTDRSTIYGAVVTTSDGVYIKTNDYGKSTLSYHKVSWRAVNGIWVLALA